MCGQSTKSNGKEILRVLQILVGRMAEGDVAPQERPADVQEPEADQEEPSSQRQLDDNDCDHVDHVHPPAAPGPLRCAFGCLCVLQICH